MDGLVVVGFSSSGSGPEAFRRTKSSGMVGLGDLPGGEFHSIANDVSGDDSVVVGWSQPASHAREAFIWNEANGMQSLRDVLISAGLNLTGWELTEAIGVSADGSVIAGAGGNPSGNNEAWRAVLTVPGSDQMLPKVDSERQDIPGQNYGLPACLQWDP
jgi:uncharacterized membrane protein